MFQGERNTDGKIYTHSFRDPDGSLVYLAGYAELSRFLIDRAHEEPDPKKRLSYLELGSKYLKEGELTIDDIGVYAEEIVKIVNPCYQYSSDRQELYDINYHVSRVLSSLPRKIPQEE